jgi:hypothetical protein
MFIKVRIGGKKHVLYAIILKSTLFLRSLIINTNP